MSYIRERANGGRAAEFKLKVAKEMNIRQAPEMRFLNIYDVLWAA